MKRAVSRAYIYYAKAGRSETAAKLDLPLVPTAAEGNTLVLLFYGVPLAKTEVTVIGPQWEKHLTTDEQGRVAVPTLVRSLRFGSYLFRSETGWLRE